MKLNEAEMRMAYQIESTDPNAVLNEIYMTWRLSRNQAARDTAESLMAKLRSLPNKECMDLIREVQANYRLPGKPQTIGEMLAEARQKSPSAEHGPLRKAALHPGRIFDGVCLPGAEPGAGGPGVGIAGALILRLAVCMKGKNAKKYRHGSVCCCSRRRPCPRPPRIGGSKGL